VRLTDVNGETPSPKPLLLDTQVVEVDKSKEQLLPPEPDEATLALQKQIADLKKSEELQREYGRRMAQEREDALRQAQTHAGEIERYKKTNQEQEEAVVGNAIAAAKAEADMAQSDYVAALNAGDNSAAGEAQRRMTRAEARLAGLELGKEEIEQRKKEPPPVAPQPRSTSADPIDGFNLPNAEKDWLRAHRDYLTDPRKQSALRYADEQVRLAGLQPGMPGYLPEIENTLRSIGSLPKPEEPNDEPEVVTHTTDRSAAIVSAPVSRETQTSTGQRASSKVRLSPEEQEFAKIAGITDVEYAKQKQKLAQHKMNGDYGERR
jgi:hypothetical protein